MILERATIGISTQATRISSTKSSHHGELLTQMGSCKQYITIWRVLPQHLQSVLSQSNRALLKASIRANSPKRPSSPQTPPSLALILLHMTAKNRSTKCHLRLEQFCPLRLPLKFTLHHLHPYLVLSETAHHHEYPAFPRRADPAEGNASLLLWETAAIIPQLNHQPSKAILWVLS